MPSIKVHLYLYSPPCLHGTLYGELCLFFMYFCVQRHSYHLKLSNAHIYVDLPLTVSWFDPHEGQVVLLFSRTFNPALGYT